MAEQVVEQVVELVPGESRAVSFEAVPHEAKTYQVQVDGLSGSFRAIAPPEPSAYLIDLQDSLADVIPRCETDPDAWHYVPVHGIQYVCDAVRLFKELMIEEAINIGMISSSADAYFADSVMYFTDGTTIVPYWWPCLYCPEKFRSPALRDEHMESVHWQLVHSEATILGISRDTVKADEEEEEIVGFSVRWRNDSPFSITVRVDCRYYDGIWRFAGEEDVTVSSGQTTSTRFPVKAFPDWSLSRERATLYLLPSMKILDVYEWRAW